MPLLCLPRCRNGTHCPAALPHVAPPMLQALPQDDFAGCADTESLDMQTADAACAATAAEQEVMLELLSIGHLVAVLTDARQRDWATLSDNTQQRFSHVQIVGLANLAACQPGAASAAHISDAQAELKAARLQIAQLQAQMQVITEA
jgi:hypothetical protein